MTNYNPYIFYDFLKSKIRSSGLKAFFFPAGYSYGISGLFPLETPTAAFPASGIFVGNLTGKSLNISWSMVPFADFYRVECAESLTASGGSAYYSGVYQTLAETENNYYTYMLTVSGTNTIRYAWWKITPIHQDLNAATPLISYFSYKYVG